MSEKHKQIVKEVDAGFSGNDIEVFFGHCAEDVEWKMAGDESRKGLQTIREWMASMPGGAPPKINLKEMIAENDKVAAYGSMTMKNENGEDVDYDYCDVYRFADNKIVELTSYVVKSA